MLRLVVKNRLLVWHHTPTTSGKHGLIHHRKICGAQKRGMHIDRTSESQKSAVSNCNLVKHGRTAHTITQGRSETVPDFEDHRQVYKSKSLKELLRAYLVFNIFSVNFLVDNQMKLLRILRSILGRSLFRWVMSSTMYGQFMAGETNSQVLGVSKRLSKAGLYPMFAYTAAEVHGYAEALGQESVDQLYEDNFEALKNAIDMAAEAKEYSSITPQLAAKITFVADAKLLRKISSIITHNEAVVAKEMGWDIKHDKALRDDSALSDRILSLSTQLRQTVNWPGFTDAHSLSYLPSLLTHIPFHLAEHTSLQGLLSPSPDEVQALLSLWKKLLHIGQRAEERGVMMIWDAEQSYLQPAIEALILDSMRLLNTRSPVIINSYQCYLKRALGVIQRDLAITGREGLCLGCKVVRGAYMVEERRLAEHDGTEDPVNETYDATTQMYHTVTDLLLDKLGQNQGQGLEHLLNVTFATHNADTVAYVLQGVERRGIRVGDGMIRFAQLYGNRDHISYALAHRGYPAAKLLHYGDIEEGLAYLSRRAHENRSGIPTVQLERRMLRREITRRLIPFYK